MKNNSLTIETIWDELAEFDLLMDYINEFFKDKVETNPELKTVLFASIYRNYSTVCPEVEVYYAEKYINSIQFFLDETEQWRNQKR